MVLSVVEAVPASSKPSAGVDVRISPGKRHGFGTSAPSSTRASFLYIMRAEDLTFLPKLVKLSCHRPGQTWYLCALLDLLQHPPYAYRSSCLFLRLPPWRDVAAELDASSPARQ